MFETSGIVSTTLTKYCIDANILIYTLNNEHPAVEFMDEVENSDCDVIYSTIVEAELFSLPTATSDDEKKVRALLDLGEIIEVRSSIALKAGELRKISNSKHNKKMKLPDAIIAATALEYDAVLVTRNYDDFKHLLDHGLKIYNPYKTTV